MNLLDENFPEDQREKLEREGVPVRQVGREIASMGVSDEFLISFLHSANRPTFFTHDRDFFRHDWCHERYCLVFLDVAPRLMERYVRQFLKQKRFQTWKQRKGLVIRAHPDGVDLWESRHSFLTSLAWDD